MWGHLCFAKMKMEYITHIAMITFRTELRWTWPKEILKQRLFLFYCLSNWSARIRRLCVHFGVGPFRKKLTTALAFLIGPTHSRWNTVRRSITKTCKMCLDPLWTPMERRHEWCILPLEIYKEFRDIKDIWQINQDANLTGCHWDFSSENRLNYLMRRRNILWMSRGVEKSSSSLTLPLFSLRTRDSGGRKRGSSCLSLNTHPFRKQQSLFFK